MILIHETRVGRAFFERDEPELVSQSTRLNENLDRGLQLKQSEEPRDEGKQGPP